MNVLLFASALISPLANASADSAMVCFRDASTNAPIVGVRVSDDSLGKSAPLMRAVLLKAPCANVPAARARFEHPAYRAQSVEIASTNSRDTVFVLLMPRVGNASAQAIAPVKVQANAERASDRMGATLSTSDARVRGVNNTSQLVAALPFATSRGARNDVGLSLRGARREQVAVTLDGVALNDPSTGAADIADIPLVAIGSATVALGSDPLGYGPGASGGVLALSSAYDRTLSLGAGSFGERSIEGAWQAQSGGALLRIGGSYSSSRNDFSFVNDAGGTNASVTEQRVNNDVSHGAFISTLSTSRAQLAVLASGSNSGMVGPINVHAYDADRARNRRVVARGAVDAGFVEILGSARAFNLDYEDPEHSALDSHSTVRAFDLEARRQDHAINWRLGGGHDEVRASNGLFAPRARGFLAISTERTVREIAAQFGARVDALEHSSFQPSFSGSLTRAWSRATVSGRLGQTVRAPTLFDLYFASPQRLTVRTLDPEHVTLDAELRGRVHSRARELRDNDRGVRWEGEVAFVRRITRSAIVWFPGNFAWSPANVGVEQLRGIESRVQIGVGHNWLSAWTTVYDAMLESGDLRIPTPYVSRVSAGLESGTHLLGTNVSLRARAMSRRPFTAGPRNAFYELPAVALADVAISRVQRVGGASLLSSMSLENVTDVAWQSVRGFPSAGRAFTVSFTISRSSRQ